MIKRAVIFLTTIFILSALLFYLLKEQSCLTFKDLLLFGNGYFLLDPQLLLVLVLVWLGFYSVLVAVSVKLKFKPDRGLLIFLFAIPLFFLIEISYPLILTLENSLVFVPLKETKVVKEKNKTYEYTPLIDKLEVEVGKKNVIYKDLHGKFVLDSQIFPISVSQRNDTFTVNTNFQFSLPPTRAFSCGKKSGILEIFSDDTLILKREAIFYVPDKLPTTILKLLLFIKFLIAILLSDLLISLLKLDKAYKTETKT